MFPSNQPRPEFEATISRMRGARWIAGHRFEKDRGYRLDWTEVGRSRAMLLQQLIIRHQLDDGITAIRFTESCLGKRRTPEGVPTAECDFWLACLEQLGIGFDKEALATFVHLIATWQPCDFSSSRDNPGSAG